jgi:predicted nucleic acid-binding protein
MIGHYRFVIKHRSSPSSARHPQGRCRDADDDRVLECACASEADCLVSGDEDLLALGGRRGIAILSPRDFDLLFPE